MEKSDAAKPCSTSDSMGYVYQRGKRSKKEEKGIKTKDNPLSKMSENE